MGGASLVRGWGCGRKVGRVSVRIGVRCVRRGAKAESRRRVLPGMRDAEEGDRRAGVPVRGVPDELDGPGSAAWSPFPPYTLDVRARAAGRVIAGERCVDVAKDVGRSATSVRKRAGAYGREGIGGLMNMGDGIRVPAVDDGVFSQVGVSFLVRYFFSGLGAGRAGRWLVIGFVVCRT